MKRQLTRRQALILGGAVGFTSILAGCGAVSGPSGLYVTGSDGAPRWIDETTGGPVWSPDGKKLCWGDDHGLRTWIETTEQVTFQSATAMVGKPTWSPDNSAVAFLDSETRELRSLTFASSAVRPLAKLYDGFDGAIRPPIVTRGGPAWSPDGLRIAFICWDGQGDELCIVNSDGSARQKLTTLGGNGSGNVARARSSVTSMAWSPDSSALAVSVQAEEQGAAAGIFRVELAARSGKRLTKMTVNAPIIWDELTDDLIYSATVEGRSDVYRLAATGGKPALVTSVLPEGAREPATDNAGNLAVVSGRQVAILEASSAEVTYLEEPGLVGSAPAISADGLRLAFLALPRPIERYP